MDFKSFKVKCLDNGNNDFYRVGKIYEVTEKGLLNDYGNYVFMFAGIKTFKELQENSNAQWELVEEEKPLLDKFYELLGVEEMEEFKLEEYDLMYRFNKGTLQFRDTTDKEWCKSNLNIFNEKIIKILKPKHFTKEEKEQLKAIFLIHGKCWITRDKNGDIYINLDKPKKSVTYWITPKSPCAELSNHIFPSIKWEDEEPYELKGYNESN